MKASDEVRGCSWRLQTLIKFDGKYHDLADADADADDDAMKA